MLSTPPAAGAADVTLVPTDTFLVDRARVGDREAYAALVHRHRDRVYRVALQVLGCPADADDVAQDVVIHLATALERFDGTAAFTTWLHRVVVNRCLNHRRAHRPTSEITESAHPRSRGPEHAVVTAAEVAAGLRAVAALPDELRVPLVLVQLEGMSYRQAAAVTGVSEATVRGRLARARYRLASAMADWTPAPAVPRTAPAAG
ncbi:RNA polymerase sigma-70 factor (ECF subfamily) [Actinomycetospora succinea]|uniref:RNA polymerase sigma-70 factor (ECF subfamily) n=1 Tax=Actinomycetospora succinea TaxID=663603 RepID=A0A4V3D9U4_9PSEU|nr:sigma-70 family RNA polymerase sigma factor [Actinomycetospora succinea]TDQ58782.1 RNA polymerase sigma-70 factor (ECF subfamily) [Actinomycetospora succinea]